MYTMYTMSAVDNLNLQNIKITIIFFSIYEYFYKTLKKNIVSYFKFFI